MSENFLVAPLLLPLIAALAGIALRNRAAWPQFLGVAGAVLTLLAAVPLLVMADEGVRVLHLGGWQAPFGICFVLDRFSAMMLAVTGLIACAVAIYSLGNIRSVDQRGFYFPLFHFLIAGVNGAFLTGDLFNLYVWFEVLLLASFVMMTLGEKPEQFEGGFKYVAMNLVSSVFFLAGLGILYGKLGTLNMADVAFKLSANPDPVVINSSAILFLCGFSIKAGLFPFFFWLPASYHTPQFAISALFAGLLTKVGVYALIRCFSLIFVPHGDFISNLLLWLAGLTMLTGVMGAASHFSMRRILSFHIISQIGYMVMGLVLFTPLALAGTLFYLVHHIVVKTNLFLVSGIVDRLSGSDDLLKNGGFYRHRGWLAVLFFIPAFSLGGIPPLSGFWAKYAVVRAGFESAAWGITAVALIVGLMTLFSMTKIWAEVFWKPAPDEQVEQRVKSGACGWQYYAPVVLLAAVTLVLGFAAQPVFQYALNASQDLLNPTPYLEATLGAEMGQLFTFQTPDP